MLVNRLLLLLRHTLHAHPRGRATRVPRRSRQALIPPCIARRTDVPCPRIDFSAVFYDFATKAERNGIRVETKDVLPLLDRRRVADRFSTVNRKFRRWKVYLWVDTNAKRRLTPAKCTGMRTMDRSWSNPRAPAHPPVRMNSLHGEIFDGMEVTKMFQDRSLRFPIFISSLSFSLFQSNQTTRQ